jgi:transcriptional regulator with XRE-family HTH domain
MKHTELGLRLKEARIGQGLSLREASKKTRIDRETLAAIEKGERHPYSLTLGKLSTGYGIPLRELLELEEPLEASASLGTAGNASAPATGQPGRWETAVEDLAEAFTAPESLETRAEALLRGDTVVIYDRDEAVEVVRALLSGEHRLVLEKLEFGGSIAATFHGPDGLSRVWLVEPNEA